MSMGSENVFPFYFYCFCYGVNFEFAAVAGFFWTLLIPQNFNDMIFFLKRLM